jgi:hypothetical protein
VLLPTEGKDEMGKRFAIVIGVAAAGVMALGAQTATSSTGDPVDSTPPDLQLSGDKPQDPQANICDRGFCDVHVKVSCGDEECTARAKGKLTKVKNDKLKPDGPRVVAAGETATLVLEMTNDTQRHQIHKALDNGKNVRAKVTVRATDAAGNVATAKRTITLVK